MPRDETKPPSETPCKGCGKKIQWCRNAQQALGSIPVDARVPIYRIERRDGKKYAVLQKPTEEWGVGHHSTCKEADQFSKSGKAKAEKLKGLRQAALEGKTALLRVLGFPGVTLLEASSIVVPADDFDHGEQLPADDVAGKLRRQLMMVADRLHTVYVGLE